jgi:hypothetical protein
LRIVVLASEVGVGYVLPDDLRYDKAEAASIVKVFAVVVPEGLLIKVAVHTNGLENFWSLLKRGLNGTYVSVEPLAVNLGHSVIDDLMGVLPRESLIGFQIITVESGTGFDVFLDFGLECALSCDLQQRLCGPCRRAPESP